MFPKKLRNQSGFTLIEMLIVVILLGILAMLIVPQISVSTEDARLSTMHANLGAMRNAIELYYYEHNNTYPGQKNVSGAATTAQAEAETAFLQQLTRYTDINGVPAVAKDGTYKYGPYLKSIALPTNPYNGSNAIVCDASLDDITDRTVDAGGAGWKFYTQSGVLMANDGQDNHENL